MTMMDNTLDRHGRSLHSKTEGTALPPLPPMNKPVESLAISVCRECPAHSDWGVGPDEPKGAYDWQLKHRQANGHCQTVLFHITRAFMLHGVVDRPTEETDA